MTSPHTTPYRKLRGITALAFWAVLATGMVRASSALACPPVRPSEPITFPPSDDHVPPVLKSARLDVRRADNPGAPRGDGSCADEGEYTFSVDAQDDVTLSKDLAYSLTLLKGRLPFSLPDKPIRPTPGLPDGELSGLFSDDGSAFDATVSVAVVDDAGNFSEPVEVHASGDEVGGCGCAFHAHQRSTMAAGLMLGAVLFARRSRRARLARPHLCDLRASASWISRF